MKKIGIIAIYKQNKFEGLNRVQFSYVDMVEKSGGIAYIIPCNTTHLDHFITQMDGFIFPGADEDVCPSLYGQENKGSRDCVLKNDQFLLNAFDKVYQAGKPVLGICKGHQMINTYFNGTLHQSMDDDGKHLNVVKYGEIVHEIDIQSGSFLYEVFSSDTLGVNSAHHQCIDTLGNNLKITARSSDGCIEAIEFTGNQQIYGLQWHPERIPDHLPIFQKFIEKI